MSHRLSVLTRSLVVTAALFAVSVQAAASAGYDGFDLRNNSGIDIVSFFLSPTDGNDWGPDILGTGVLPSGATTYIAFTDNAPDTCLWDMMVLGRGGQEGYLYKVDICSTDLVTFS